MTRTYDESVTSDDLSVSLGIVDKVVSTSEGERVLRGLAF